MKIPFRDTLSRLGRHPWLAGVALVVVAVGVQQTYPAVADRSPPSREAVASELKESPSHLLALARLHLLARQPAQAASFLQRLEKDDSSAISREVLAAYLGLCAEMQGDHQTARAHYRMAGTEHAYYALACARMPRVDRVAALMRPDEEEPREEKARKQVLEKIKAAEDRVRTNPGADTRVLLLSWRFLYAELAVGTDRALPGLGLEQFNKGFDELLKLEADIAKAPTLQEAIDKDPSVRARLDTVRTRLPAVTGKFTAARDAERKRLETLRAIVRRYRGTATQPGLAAELARTTTAMMVGDSVAASVAVSAAGKQADEIAKLVTAVKDEYLFEDENEKLLPTEVGPFGQSFQTHLALTQGYIKYAEAARTPTAPGAEKLLREADALVKEVLAKEKDNALGLYVRGMVAEALGVAKKRANPADADAQKEAAPLLTDARDSLEKASVALGKLPGAETNALLGQVKRRMAKLESVAAYLDEAKELTSSGRIDEAHALLAEGQLRHRDPLLWSARAETARRAHLQGRPKVAEEAIKELVAARDAKVFADNDPKTLLAEGKLHLALADVDVARIDKLDAVAKKSLVDRLDVATGKLQKALDNSPKDRIERARRSGYLALALAYQQLVAPAKDARRDPEVRRAFALAADAITEMGTLEAQAVDDREALSAGQLARGHLAVVVLPAYREEATKAFGKAIAESAALPYPSKGLGSLGSAYLTEIARRPENAGLKHVEELTRQRRVMAGFVDGVVVLTQNEPAAAVQKMEQGLRARKEPVKTDDPLEEIDLEDRLLGYLALGQVESGKPGDGVLTVLRTVEEDLTEVEAIRRSEELARKVGAPLLTYALGVALEKRAEAYGLGDQPLRAPALAGARAAYARAASMLDAPSAKIALPGYRQEAGKAVARLASDKEYLAGWRTHREDNRLMQAEETAKAGFARHPKSSELWRAYLDTRLSRLMVSGDKDPKQWRSLLTDLEQMSAQAGGLRFERAFWEGLVRQQLKESEQAAGLFEEARKRAETPEDRVRAQTRVIESRLDRGPTR